MCARVVDTSRVSCAVEEVATVDGAFASPFARNSTRARSRLATAPATATASRGLKKRSLRTLNPQP